MVCSNINVLGLPNNLFTEEVKDRKPMKENLSYKVLSLSNDNTLNVIYDNLLKQPSRWNDIQTETIHHLFQENPCVLDIDNSPFKENILSLSRYALNDLKLKEVNISLSTATDVLRLAAGLSNSDVSLKTKPKFIHFSRPQRKLLLSLLDSSNNLLDDVISKPEMFKRLFSHLRPGDYKFNRVSEVYNKLYNKDYVSFDSTIKSLVTSLDNKALSILEKQPGKLFRQFHEMYSNFGKEAITSLEKVVSDLSILQLLKLEKYISTINDRKFLIVAPKGNWNKVQVLPNNKLKFNDTDKSNVLSILENELSLRLSQEFPNGVDLDSKTKSIKLQTNDQELADYGRGTEFDIPDNIKFLRSASYWKNDPSLGNTWYDNGFNLFDKNFNAIGTCCWNKTTKGTLFSGDPTNSKELKGRACQMIDIYLDELEARNVRYAVWNVLAYSRIPFAEANDVLATLQFGEHKQKGSLFEPSRAKMVFKIQGNNLTKYVAYIDVKKRKLVYMDANLPGNTSSAGQNEFILQDKMPAFLEYLDSLPTVYDLFKFAPKGDMPILYSDKDVDIKDTLAYVFTKENQDNSFTNYSYNELLSQKRNTFNFKINN